MQRGFQMAHSLWQDASEHLLSLQADAGWETAVAVLKTVLNIALDTVASPSVMLRLKDFVLLVCSALGMLPLGNFF